MEFALTEEKKYIRANAARSNVKYYCPVCEKPMIHCEGLKIPAYFRHPQGAECEKIISNNSYYKKNNQTISNKNDLNNEFNSEAELTPGKLEDLWQMNFRVAIFENTDSKTQFKIFDDNAKYGLINKKWYGYFRSPNGKTFTSKSVEIYYPNEPKWRLKWKLTFKEADY